MINRKEITQLSSGRETDIIVAEQVMGWQVETDEVKLKQLNRYISQKAGDRWWRTPEGGWCCDPPAYSSEIAATWKVVETMKTKGRFLFLFQGPAGNKVAFAESLASNSDYITEKNLTGAICKAALMASIQAERILDTEMEVSRLGQKLIHAILQEIDTCLHEGILPLDDVYLKHLSEKGEVLEYLRFLRDERLIGGALVTRGIDNTPYRMTNITLTYLGRRALRLELVSRRPEIL